MFRFFCRNPAVTGLGILTVGGVSLGMVWNKYTGSIDPNGGMRFTPTSAGRTIEDITSQSGNIKIMQEVEPHEPSVMKRFTASQDVGIEQRVTGGPSRLPPH